MNRLSILVLPILLASCATTGTQMQAECESKFTRFPDIVRCTRENVAARNPAILQDARGKLYLLLGEELASHVESGAMTDIQAKVQWQRLYVELRDAKLEEIHKQLDSERPLLRCESKPVGHKVVTECR